MEQVRLGAGAEILKGVLDEYFAGKEVHHLDFACGTGRIIEFMSGHTTESTGVDVSPSMLAEARGKGIDARLIEADITDSDELAGETFNLITAFRFFLNAEPELRASAITALGKRLAPDGVLVFNNHHNSGSPYVEVVADQGIQLRTQCLERHVPSRDARPGRPRGP